MTAFSHSLAILIGIDAYSNGVPRLTTAVNDATELADLLRTEHGYETILLTEDEIGQPVTLARLRTLFTEELAARLGENDRLLVYFAGHGVASDGDGGPAGYLVPQDGRSGDSASMLPMTDLHAWLTALSCRHMLAILDCCFAGAFRWSATRNLGVLPAVIYKERYDRYLLSPAWQVLTSASYDQKALDVLAGDAKRGTRTGDRGLHSPFALALFDALEKGEADLVPKNGGDGVITATELYLYLRERVEVQADVQANHQQTPGLWPLNKHRKGEFIFLSPVHPLNLPPAPDLTGEANPYRGLKSYDQKHRTLFFGRDQEIEELAILVDQQPFIAVLGASGTGKSSLVKAGVLPRLLYSVLPPMRPTDHPLRALEALLHSALDEDAIGLVGGDDGLAKIIARWAAAHPEQRLVLTIDQFEELVTLCGDNAERDRFLRLLATTIEKQPEAFRLIITLRTDFEPQFTQKDSPLAGLWKVGRYVVPPMDIEDLRQVIEGPASVRVLYFDPPELVDALIKEVIQAPGALPLLSFTLSELYVKYAQNGRDDRALSGEDYQALGGVVGSLRNRASEEYNTLPDDAHRVTMQQVMLRMVAVGGGELARRRVTLSELDYPTTQENERVKTVLDRLVDARLLVRGSGENADGTKTKGYIEPTHDALVLAWDKLLRWKNEAEEYLPLQRRLAQAATDWQEIGLEAAAGLLWNDDPYLPQVEDTLWPTIRGSGFRRRAHRILQVLWPTAGLPADTKWLNEKELRFTQASVSRRAITFRRIIGITVAVMAALLGLTLLANAQRISADEQTRRANVGELTALSKANLSTDPELSVLLASTALSKARPDYASKAEDALREALRMSKIENRTDIGSTPMAVAFRADGAQYAIATSTGWIEVRDTRTNDLLQAFDLGSDTEIYTLAFSPRREALVAASASSNLVSVWDVKSGEKILAIPQNASTRFIDFSPDGSMLVMQSEDKVVKLWGISDSMEIARQNISDANGIKFSPDGKAIAVVVWPDSISLWDGRLGRELHRWDTVEDVDEEIWNVAISIDDQLAVGSSAGKVYVWDISDVEAPREVYKGSGHKDYVFEMTFSPDGRCLATTSNDHTVILWDKAGNQQVVLLGHRGLADGAAFLQAESPSDQSLTACGSRQLATISMDDYTVRTWNIDASYEYRTLATRQGAIEAIKFSNDGRYLVTAGDSGIAQLWTTTPTFQLLGSMMHSDRIEEVSFSPDDQLIATASWDGTVKVWDTLTRAVRQELKDHVGRVFSVAFRPPDGLQLATAGEDGKVMLWDSTTGARVDGSTWTLDNSGIYSVEFNQDGTQLITGSINGLSQIVDIASSKVITISLGQGNLVYDAAFQPGRENVVTASLDGKVRRWNISDDKTSYDKDQDSVVIALHETRIHSISFDRKGELLAMGAKDGRILILDMTTNPPTTASTFGSESSVNSVTFSPDGQFLAAADHDGMIRFYIVQPEALVDFAQRSRVTRSFTPDECKIYPIEPPCPGEQP